MALRRSIDRAALLFATGCALFAGQLAAEQAAASASDPGASKAGFAVTRAEWTLQPQVISTGLALSRGNLLPVIRQTRPGPKHAFVRIAYQIGAEYPFADTALRLKFGDVKLVVDGSEQTSAYSTFYVSQAELDGAGFKSWSMPGDGDGPKRIWMDGLETAVARGRPRSGLLLFVLPRAALGKAKLRFDGTDYPLLIKPEAGSGHAR